nr:circumsporozoite protein - malaria parasite (Plasmodium falciparum) (isolate 366-2) (fragments) [Plasmodium falciparum]
PSDQHIEKYLQKIRNSLSIKPGSANKPKDQLNYENDIE